MTAKEYVIVEAEKVNCNAYEHANRGICSDYCSQGKRYTLQLGQTWEEAEEYIRKILDKVTST